MSRPTRKKLKFDEESVNKLLQEIYNDSHNLKAKYTRLFTKWEAKVKEGGEIQAIGDNIVKLLNAESKVQDQKIMILKYLKEVVFNIKSKDDDNSDSEKKSVNTDRRNELLNFVHDMQNGIKDK
jgi:hypothetical protein